MPQLPPAVVAIALVALGLLALKVFVGITRFVFRLLILLIVLGGGAYYLWFHVLN